MEQTSKSMTNTKEEIIGALFSLIRARVCGNETEPHRPDGEGLPRLYQLSKLHDVAHLLTDGLEAAGLPDEGEILAKFRKQRMVALYRYEQSNYELSALSAVLEAEKIPFIPLKGAILREHYPEPWMRTSCDIDVLVKREDLSAASAALSEKLGYRKEAQGSHDLSLFSPGGVHVELHFALNEENYRVFDTLSRIWEVALPEQEGGYRYTMPDEVFYFYHIAHMAKHFEEGGCGIRSFLDLWILDHRMEHDDAKRDALLIKEGMYAFAEGCRRLCEVWFSCAEGNELTVQMQNYILDGGVYGTVANKVTVQQTKQGGKVRYALRRIFVPYETMKVYYPILRTRKWLTPFMEVRRWVKILFGGRVKRSLTELNANQSVSADAQKNTKSLLSELGLHDN